MATSKSTVPGTRIQDRTGEQYGSWTVLRFSHRRGRCYYWLCRCRCGGEKPVAIDSLRRGFSTRCIRCSRTAGPVRSAEHRVYRDMMARCYNPNKENYHMYGGRGIAVCHRWRDDCDTFLADMGPRPTSKHSLDRINNEGDYEPSNCRWATQTEQNRNQRSNHLLTFRGQTMCIAAWADRVGISADTLYCRINKQQWTVEHALTTPVARK